MTVPDDVQGGFSALYDLLHTVEVGRFYEDYDESTALLARAKEGFETIRAEMVRLQSENTGMSWRLNPESMGQ